MVRRLVAGLIVAVVSAGAVGLGAGASEAAVRRDDINSDIVTAVNSTNRFWAVHFRSLFGGTYSAPKIFGGFSRAGRAAPFCGNRRLSFNNAAYCGRGDFMAWDLDFMASGYRFGDAWVYLVIAHEWGHAIQARISGRLVSRAVELQADCLAGAALFGAAKDRTLKFESGDVEELAAAFNRLGDRTPWTKSSDHGTAKQRLAAFNAGAKGGVRGCLPKQSAQR
ncbi:neutral zinc metallopeptidase [Streptosporangiaceae bacterium NEAU-GS5]|nr:neutral zinc metallopeptidase [Streptosporangiaceae bacterium NEAU-GS5]